MEAVMSFELKKGKFIKLVELEKECLLFSPALFP